MSRSQAKEAYYGAVRQAEKSGLAPEDWDDYALEATYKAGMLHAAQIARGQDPIDMALAGQHAGMDVAAAVEAEVSDG